MTTDSADPDAKPSFLDRFRASLRRRSRPAAVAPDPAPEEIIDQAGIETSQEEMIRGVINLSSKIAREIMIPRVDLVAIDSGTTLKDIIQLILDEGHSRFPVFESTIDNVVGILHVKDLLKFIIDKPKQFHVKKVLRKPYFVPETMGLDDLLREFKRRRLHIAIVVDEYGGVGGIITLEDILEEIVGDIGDEFDENEPPEIIKISQRSFEVDSRLTITDFNEATGHSLPADQFDTVGGLVLDLFGKIPVKNETAALGPLSFKIKDITGTRINRILVTASPRKSAGDANPKD